ncbi:hypothetical protein FOQG_19336 [Fusarium oxysporum f. sp. raphani 54005]|uniref:Uncharacterized protein n=2 Tax=Fusarium oxysporum TaxID=5507 RepID=X0B1A8_FUSOX|nr:hypothetical protein FOQG_19336 [Fusarium oxysporum f. sp. raphani 54005]EXL64250.1 hypothetical protein FOPG_19482 [Fusarium oxysporum f. sp. conglutinans race 2 54008]
MSILRPRSSASIYLQFSRALFHQMLGFSLTILTRSGITLSPSITSIAG